MPRQAGLDALGALHHVTGRGIEGILFFRRNEDREDFLARLGALCEGELPSVHAWRRSFPPPHSYGDTEDV